MPVVLEPAKMSSTVSPGSVRKADDELRQLGAEPRSVWCHSHGFAGGRVLSIGNQKGNFFASLSEANQRPVVSLSPNHEAALSDGGRSGNTPAGDLVLFDERTVGEFGFVEESVF